MKKNLLLAMGLYIHNIKVFNINDAFIS